MTETYKTLNNRKKQRLKINNINDFKQALIKEGYEDVYLDNFVTDRIYESLSDEDITYRADNVLDFVDYIQNIDVFRSEHKKLSKKINQISKLNIHRVEYDRVTSTQDNIDHMIEDIENIKNTVVKRIDFKDIYRLEEIEKQLDKDNIYTKDIELLKKIISNGSKVEKYNEKSKTKTISIEIPKEMNNEYIPAKLGSIEYHNHIKNNIPRIKRLRRNLKKYMIDVSDDNKSFNINQSEVLQDTINIAVAVYDNKEFKAISGSNEVEEFCRAPKERDARFISSKVNKLGKLGVGYNRVNDSEKKIFEEINKQIELGIVKNNGKLNLYSKWEPCPSCYYVISQFCKKHPSIDVSVKFCKKYGE